MNPLGLPSLHRSFTTTINGQPFVIQADNLKIVHVLGQGSYGIVEKMKHIPSGTSMAVKKIIQTMDIEHQRRLSRGLDISLKASGYQYAVQCYGAFSSEGVVWICMEVMDMSLDNFYKKVYKNNQEIPESVLHTITVAVVNALHYLHVELEVIHRDVKPSNILISRNGDVKICDFGISGYLVNSVARTRDAGCEFYMAPERINSSDERDPVYDVRSDVWSLGISLVELATGKYPYSPWEDIFVKRNEVVNENSPSLPPGKFTSNFEDFVCQCLQKDRNNRPSYRELLRHQFISQNYHQPELVSHYFNRILELPD